MGSDSPTVGDYHTVGIEGTNCPGGQDVDSTISIQPHEQLRSVAGSGNHATSSNVRTTLTPWWATADRSSAQLGLFEQILNIPVTSQVSDQESSSASAPAEAEHDTVNSPTDEVEESDRSTSQGGEDESSASDTWQILNASYSQTQLPASTKETAFPGRDELQSHNQPKVLNQSAVAETAEAAAVPQTFSKQSDSNIAHVGEPTAAPLSNALASNLDKKAEPPTQAKSLKLESGERRIREEGPKTRTTNAANEELRRDSAEFPSLATDTSPSDSQRQVFDNSRSAINRDEIKPEFQVQPADKTHTEDASRREKWFEKPSNETRLETSGLSEQAISKLENDTPAIANQRGELLAEPTNLSEVQNYPSVESAAQLAAENAAASAVAAMAGSSSSPSVSSQASRAIVSTPPVSGTPIAENATPENGTRRTGTMPTIAGSGTGLDEDGVAPNSEETRQLSQQERVRLVQRVARSFSRLSADGGQISLRLHPPQLGSLNVSVRIEGRSMSAKLLTETTAARDAILENLPMLRQRLADQGVDVQQFQVELAGNQADASNGSFNPSSNQSESELSRQSSSYRVDYRRLSSQSVTPLASGNERADHTLLAAGTLDLRV